MHKEVEDFITECVKHSHYAHAKQIPKKFENWQKDNLVVDYANWVIEESNCPSLKLNIPIPHEEMYFEALDCANRLVKHRSHENNRGWRSMCVHGVSTEYTDHWNVFGDFATEPEYNWTDIAEHCPATVDWLKSFPCTKYNRVRFMFLDPKGFIWPHRDTQNRCLDAINVSLNNPEGCNFYMEEAGMIPWKPGDVRAIDIGRKHSVINKSMEDRVHMIVHGWWDIGLLQKICEGYDEVWQK
jgi:hypothetical protein